MIVWGGADNNDFLNTGGRYNPITNSPTATSTINAPDAAKPDTRAVWTDNKMIVSGGLKPTSLLNTGGRYDPIMDSWTDNSTINAPSWPIFAHSSLDR